MAADPTDPLDDDTDTGAAAPADSGDSSADDAAQPTVLCTIMSNGDGTYTLTEGDEDDDSDDSDSGAGASGGAGDMGDDSGAGADDAGSGEGAEGMPPAAGGVAAAPKGQTFDSPGPLLKAVLELLKADEEKSGGSADDNFNAGFSGSDASTSKS